MGTLERLGLKDYIRLNVEWLDDAFTRQSLERQIEALDRDIRKTTFGGGGRGVPDGDPLGDYGFAMGMPRPINPFVGGGNRKRPRF